MGHALWCFKNLVSYRQANPIPSNHALAKKSFASAVSALQQAKNFATELGVEFIKVGPQIDAALALVNSFNWNAEGGFMSPLPSSYPQIIGPHGHYDAAMNASFFMNGYIGENLGGTVGLYNPKNVPVWSPEASLHYSQVVTATGDLLNRWARGTALTAEVETQEDAKIISSDAAQGTGLRPRSFFRALFAHELFMHDVDGTKPDFSKRYAQIGVAAALAELLKSGSTLVGYIDRSNPGFSAANLTASGGIAGTISVIWRHSDRWSFSNNGFFFEIPPPPVPETDPQPDPTETVIPVGFFAADVARLDEISSDAMAVKQSLLSKEGQPV
jgi:hypothetical protein